MLKITASFDDGSEQDNRSAELMDKYNIDTVFYIPVNYQKYLERKGIPSLSDEDFKRITERFELGAHGVNHELLTQVDDEVMKYEVATSKQSLEEKSGWLVTKFCYPRGYYSDIIIQTVRESGYNMARTVKVGSLEPMEGFEAATTVHIGCNRKEYGGEDWYQYALNRLSEALSRVATGTDTEYHMWGHGYEIERNAGWQKFEELLRVIDENTPR